MKTKIKLTTFLLLTTISFSALIKADEVIIPVIAKPTILQEGTQRELTNDQIADLLPWAKNSKMFLSDLLTNADDLSMSDRVERLTDGIKQLIEESSSKNSELFMRYVLNRALVLTDILDKNMDANAVGTIDAKARVLSLSIKLAVKYSDIDMNIMNKKLSNSPFAAFGVEYFNFLTEINKSIFAASAEYSIERTSLEWLQWDLYRDLANTSFAPSIIKINNGLKTFPAKKLSDAQSISYIHKLKKLIQLIDINQVMTQLDNDRAAKDKEYAQEIENKRKQAEMEERAKLNSDAQKALDIKKMKSALKKDEKVYYIDSSNNSYEATIIGKQENGSYSIRFSGGGVAGNIDRSNLAATSGCGESGLCVGDYLINLKRDYDYVRIVGVQFDGHFVIRYEKGEKTRVGGHAGGWGAGNFARTSGCSDQGFCVGDKVVNTSKNAEAIIIGIQIDNNYVLQFTTTALKDRIGENWTKSDLIKE